MTKKPTPKPETAEPLPSRARAREWPASHIERRHIDALIPYARNARTHSDEQVAQIAASIREFGWTIPVLLDEADGIIAGHGRVMAARKLGIKDIPVMIARGWSEAQKRAYVLADNQLALNAGWDMDLLRVELGDLQAMDFNLDLVGFDSAFLDKLLNVGTEGLTDPDEVPETPSVPVTRPGDVWVLGKHRLLCGDSTVATDVERVLAGVTPLLMVTDPPYGVEYDATWRGKAGHATLGKNRTGVVAHDDRADWREAWALFPGNIAYVWHGGLMGGVVADSLIACGFHDRRDTRSRDRDDDRRSSRDDERERRDTRSQRDREDDRRHSRDDTRTRERGRTLDDRARSDQYDGPNDEIPFD